MDPFLMCKVKGTVILFIWWKVLLVAAYTAGLVYCRKEIYHMNINFSGTLIRTLGVVTGLLLVFRTSTAYDRYWEGRKLWSTMKTHIRTLTRCIWVMVDEKEEKKKNEQQESEEESKKEQLGESVTAKVSAINLLVAFAYATRNYLRGNYSYDQKELVELIGHLPRFSTSALATETPDQVKVPSSESANGGNNDRGKSVEPTRRSSTGSIQFRREGGTWRGNPYKSSSSKAYETAVPANIPIEISYYIASYIKSIDSPISKDMNSALNGMVDCLSGFERIVRTPIPLAYSVHLRHVTWMYIFILPYELLQELNWFTIPAVSMAAFALFGILAIGREIENPFEDDENDLPIDDFCYAIHDEVLGVMGHTMPTPNSWLFSNENRVFPLELQVDEYTASDLAKMTDEQVRAILANVRRTQREFWEMKTDQRLCKCLLR